MNLPNEYGLSVLILIRFYSKAVDIIIEGGNSYFTKTTCAGHFVKAIRNGIEYGLMQAYAEGFDILRNANTNDLPEDHRYDFKKDSIGSVVIIQCGKDENFN